MVLFVKVSVLDAVILVAKAFVIVVAKLLSSPNAAAISLRVSKASGALSIRFDIAVLTYV